MRITEKLAEYVRERMKELNFSTYDVARESDGEISNGSVYNIYSLKVKDIKDKTFEALAKGLKISVRELRSNVENRNQNRSNYKIIDEILAEANDLSETEINEMKHIWDMVRVEISRRKLRK